MRSFLSHLARLNEDILFLNMILGTRNHGAIQRTTPQAAAGVVAQVFVRPCQELSITLARGQHAGHTHDLHLTSSSSTVWHYYELRVDLVGFHSNPNNMVATIDVGWMASSALLL